MNEDLDQLKSRVVAFNQENGYYPDKIIMSAEQRLKFEGVEYVCGVPIVIGKSGIHLFGRTLTLDDV